MPLAPLLRVNPVPLAPLLRGAFDERVGVPSLCLCPRRSRSLGRVETTKMKHMPNRNARFLPYVCATTHRNARYVRCLFALSSQCALDKSQKPCFSSCDEKKFKTTRNSQTNTAMSFEFQCRQKPFTHSERFLSLYHRILTKQRHARSCSRYH